MLEQNIKCIDSKVDINGAVDESFNYWNDKEEEKGKAFNIELGFSDLESSQHLLDIYNQSKKIIDEFHREVTKRTQQGDNP